MLPAIRRVMLAGAINENDVRDAALEAGLVDVKVVSFSSTLSALKLVIRLVDRPR